LSNYLSQFYQNSSFSRFRCKIKRFATFLAITYKLLFLLFPSYFGREFPHGRTSVTSSQFTVELKIEKYYSFTFATIYIRKRTSQLDSQGLRSVDNFEVRNIIFLKDIFHV
jgi:uncharacterized membrane protein (DUF485 family)